MHQPLSEIDAISIVIFLASLAISIVGEAVSNIQKGRWLFVAINILVIPAIVKVIFDVCQVW